jgi:hypothetical protein
VIFICLFFVLFVSINNWGEKGDGLLKLLESRTSGEFRVTVRGDLEKARSLANDFQCTEEWQDKIVLLDRRQVVQVRSHKDEARVRDQLVSGQAVPGKIWIAYLAATSRFEKSILVCRRSSDVFQVFLRCCRICWKSFESHNERKSRRPMRSTFAMLAAAMKKVKNRARVVVSPCLMQKKKKKKKKSITKMQQVQSAVVLQQRLSGEGLGNAQAELWRKPTSFCSEI